MSIDKDSQTKSDVDLCIFHDIFRRADKNDDGAISWTEFASYFSDGIVTDDGMRSLFNEIDSHHTNNIDTHELCSYFSERLGYHEPVFEAAAALCTAVSASVKCLADTHAAKSPASQFVDRFLLRELCAHLEAQLQVLRNAHESLRRRARELAMPVVAVSPPSSPQQPPPSQQALQPHQQQQQAPPPPPRPPPPKVAELLDDDDEEDSEKSPTNATMSQQQPHHQQHPPHNLMTVEMFDRKMNGGDDSSGSSGRLSWEVARLQRLLDRLECRTTLATGTVRIEEAAMDEEEQLILIVRRRVTVPEEQLAAFRSAVKKYSTCMEGVASCLFLSARHYRETGSVVLYEFWESLGSWRKFLPSPASKELRRGMVDCAEAPESTETLLLPSEWWKNLER